MTTTALPILVGGCYVEPKAYELMFTIVAELFAADLKDTVDALRQTVFGQYGVLVKDPELGPTARVHAAPRKWRLTDEGEVLLEELRALVCTPGLSRDQMQVGVLSALRSRGYQVRPA